MNELNRREFLQQAGLSTTAFVLSFHVPLKSQKAWAGGEDGYSTHYIAVGSNEGEFVFTMDKAEMGQGVITGQLTLFCEEAGLAPQKVKVITAPVAEIYGTLSGMQLTGGSSSTKDRWQVLRQAGANMRGTFIKAASKKLSEPENTLSAKDGFITSLNTGKSISYNELAASCTEVIKDYPLKNEKDFLYIGKPTLKKDAYEKSMGLAEYGIDFQKEDLLTAVILRSPTFGGKLKSFDASQAMDLPGIKKILKTSRGLAIVGDKYWQVNKARDLVKVEWEKGPNGDISSEKIQSDYAQLLEKNGKEIHSTGEADSILEKAEEGDKIVAEYFLPYLSHSPMEPMNAAAEVQPDRVDVWSPNQGPTLIRNEVADFCGMAREKVVVHTTKYLGGGFGRRSTLDYTMEAVELSQLLKAPVKVVWSREDDTRHSPMRPISRHRFEAVVKDGQVNAWRHRIAAESIMQGVMPSWIPLMLPGWVPSFLRSGIGGIAGSAMRGFNFHMTTGEGAKIEYEIPNVQIEVSQKGYSIPIHFWRSVGHSFNGFVKESFMDEVAHKAGKDPVEFRKSLLQNNKRALGVIDEVVKLSGWGRPMAEGMARGFAYHFSFDSYVAEVADVRIVDDKIKVEKVYCAVDCGIAVNPDIVEEQMKSGIIYGLSAALGGEINIVEGSVQQSNFHDYPVIRMSEAPEMEVSIVSSTESPTGVGEPGLPPLAAAVGNALFSLTGKRHRSLPFTL